MAPAAQAFFRSILDYAGMFPPARLSLAESFAQYQKHRGSQQSALLGRFVVPAVALDSLSELVRDDAGGDPFRLALTIKMEDSALADALRLVEEIGEAVRRTESAVANLQVDSIETDLPGGLPDRDIERLIAALEKSFLISGNPGRMVFLELKWQGIYEPAMKLAAGRGSWFGVKLRTGGLSADRIPPAPAVAAFLQAAALHRLPMKATAGLHQPVPHVDAEVGARVHGFLNLFAAAMLAYRDQPSRDTLVRIVEEFSYPDFRFESDVLHLGDITTFSVGEITSLRELIRGFGSCSFDEPVEHLTAHGILEPATMKRQAVS